MSKNRITELVREKHQKNCTLLFYVDTEKGSGLGHLMRSIILAEKFKDIDHKGLVTSEKINTCIEFPTGLKHYESLDEFINLNSGSSLALVLDTYDVKASHDVVTKIKTKSKKINILDITYLCDTETQALEIFKKFSPNNILFPNILNEKSFQNLKILSEGNGSRLMHGIHCLLLDKKVTSYMAKRELISAYKLQQQRVMCIISMGFSCGKHLDSSKSKVTKSLKTIKRIIPNIEFTLIGSNALTLCSELDLSEEKYEYHEFCKKDILIDLYDNSDFHIGALGYSMWERAARSLPSYVIPISGNQKPYVEIGESLGILTDIDKIHDPYFDMRESLNGMIKAGNKFYGKIKKSVA